MEKRDGWVDLALFPLTVLARSRGWKRGGIVALYLLVGVFGWRESSLWRLPDVGEPFDVDRLGRVELADAENAMVAYRVAAGRLIAAKPQAYPTTTPKAWDSTDWATAEPSIQRWAIDNRPVLGPWLLGTERPDSLLIQPKDLEVGSILAPIHELPTLARYAMLESSRLELAGDLPGAWKLLRGVLRSSRHAGQHGTMIQRLIGNAILQRARPAVQQWISHPAVKPDLLKAAIADLEVCRAMTAPASQMVMAEYLIARDMLRHPESWRDWATPGDDILSVWIRQVTFITPVINTWEREPERSLRILRLITAGALQECDRLRASRSRTLSSKYGIYGVSPGGSSRYGPLAPDELVRWADRSAYRTIRVDFDSWIKRLDFEVSVLDQLRIAMAERAYELDRGKPPATYGDLLGTYLKTLPDGYEAGDSAATPAPP